MSQPLLVCTNVSKCFATYASNLGRFATWIGASVRPQNEFWALRDASFQVHPGEAVALIGQNGSGKSTLLKLITGTLRASSGDIRLSGKVNAILELGVGLNYEFSGRENVALVGGLMGWSQQSIAERTPEIAAFAELGEYFDNPVRTYSSGMLGRLSFSIATAERPDILIVDEALSVGDSYFSHKSFSRIRDFKKQGTSLLFVSHSMGDVRELCDRVLLLDKGKVLMDAPPDLVVDYYNSLIAERENAKLTIEQRRQKDGWVVTRSGTHEATVRSIRLCDANSNEDVAVVKVGQRLVVVATVDIHKDLDAFVLGYMLRDRTGHIVWGTNTWHTQQRLFELKSGQSLVFRLPFTCNLGPGSYSFSPALVSDSTHLTNNYEWTDNALVFDVVNTDRHVFIGSSWLDAQFEIGDA